MGVGTSTISAKLNSITGSTVLTVTASFSACDVNHDGLFTVADVQAMVNQALGKSPAANDLNGDHVVNAVDIRIVINAVLNLGCTGVSWGGQATAPPDGPPTGTKLWVARPHRANELRFRCGSPTHPRRASGKRCYNQFHGRREAVSVAEEYRADFGAPLKPQPAVDGLPA